jgi:hypothetical protein
MARFAAVRLYQHVKRRAAAGVRAAAAAAGARPCRCHGVVAQGVGGAGQVRDGHRHRGRVQELAGREHLPQAPLGEHEYAADGSEGGAREECKLDRGGLGGALDGHRGDDACDELGWLGRKMVWET